MSRGHLVKKDELMATSAGRLLITNTRVYLAVDPGKKPLSVWLRSISGLHVYENGGLEICEDGYERPYLFMMDQTDAEITDVLMSRLLNRGETK
jgi:hypothetical protein